MSKVNFSNFSGPLTSVPSTWKDVETCASSSQTDDALYKFGEQETQTGTQTEIIHDEVKAKYTGMSVLDFMSKKHKRMDKDTWRKGIENGNVTITDAEECAVQTNPETKIKGEDFVEYVCVSCEVGTQTAQAASSSSSSSSSPGDAPGTGAGEEGKSTEAESKYTENGYEAEAEGKERGAFVHEANEYKTSESKQTGDSTGSGAAVSSFLKRTTPLVEDMLRENITSTAFDGYDDKGNNSGVDAKEIKYWKSLTVDLEKKKVVYPDWSKAVHRAARVTRQVLTRNRERIYDLEFDDSSRLLGVREEHIRITGENISSAAAAAAVSQDSNNSSRNRNSPQKVNAPAPVTVSEGMRVHVMVKQRGNKAPKGFPGRVTKAHRVGTYDVDYEGGSSVNDVQLGDLAVGLVEGQTVEARKPIPVQLQGTGVSWNATGASLSVSYGLDNITGWCDSPGAVCIWNIFARTFNSKDPDYTLDHPSCLMCVQFHPVLPNIVAAGSFNGEVVLWDLNATDQTPSISPIADYSHKEPITSLQWVKEGTASSGTDKWLLASAGSDGRVLFWTTENNLVNPVLGGVLSRTQKASKRSYPAAYGATALAFSGGTGSLSRPLWLMAGSETGGLLRGQTARFFSTPRLTKKVLDNYIGEKGDEREKGDGVYPPLKRANEVFAHESHIGAVHAIDFSPFSRNLFLSCGSDGTLRLSHLLESSPIRIWEPAPAPGTSGVGSEPFSPLSCVQFSPTRPLVFATASTVGFIYLFDLAVQATGPIAALEVPAKADGDQGAGDADMSAASKSRRKGRSGNSRRTGFSGLAFNRKQRGLLAACDYKGNVHIWRLGWSFTSKRAEESTMLENMDSGGSGENTDFDF